VPSRQGMSKMRAMTALRRSRSTQKVAVFSSVLEDQAELPRFRNMAVAGLLELGGVRAEQALVESAPHVDEYTAATLAQALGRIGSPDSIGVLRDLRTAAAPAVKGRVDFAISLLAYRHNLSGDEVDVPASNRRLKLEAGTRTLPIAVAAARRTEFETANHALKREPLGITLSPEGARRIVCGPNAFLLLWNEEFVGRRLAALRQRKGVAGVLFLKSRFEKGYSVSSTVLVTPGRRNLKLSLHKLGGDVMFAGSVTFGRDGQTRLDLRSVRRPGAAAMEFSGTIANGRLKIEGAPSSATAQKRRVPESG